MRCRTCKRAKPDTEFAIKRGDVRNRECKECKRAYNKTWYAKNRKRHIKAVRRNTIRYYQKRREFLDPLKDKPCADCGGKFPPYVMDFDHLEPSRKLGNVSQLINKQRILEEIAKCELVCANCHRIRTHKRAHSPADGTSPSKRS